MDDTKFNALLTLLDDTDPVVKAQVEEEFFSAGDAVLPKLLEASTTLVDSELQGRVNELIAKIQLGHFSEELLDWRKDGGKDLLEAWILVSQVADPQLNVQKYRDAISRLVNRTWLQLKPGMSDLEKLCVLNKLVYGIENFNGNFSSPELPQNNYLSYVVDNKTGNSLSLCLLYAILADKLDITLQLVNFQGYYALRYYSRDQHFYLDAYNKGLFFTPQQVQRFLSKLGVDDNINHYKSLTNIYVVLQLLEAIIATHDRNGDERETELYRHLLQGIEITFE